jgi:hypothetical protein
VANLPAKRQKILKESVCINSLKYIAIFKKKTAKKRLKSCSACCILRRSIHTIELTNNFYAFSRREIISYRCDRMRNGDIQKTYFLERDDADQT